MWRVMCCGIYFSTDFAAVIFLLTQRQIRTTAPVYQHPSVYRGVIISCVGYMDWYMCDTCVALNMYFKTVWPFQTAICFRKCPETSRSTTGFHATPWKFSLVCKECPQFCKLWVWNPLTSCCWDQDAHMKQPVSYLGCLLHPTTDSSQQTTDNRQHTGNTDQGLVNSGRRHETQRNTHANAQQRHTTKHWGWLTCCALK